MKGFKSFNSKSAIATATSVAVAGAGSAALDWALAKWSDRPTWLTDTILSATKIIGGAVAGSMVKNQIVKSVCDGVATVAAANLVAEYLPATKVEGLPEGTIGRLRMGQRGFRNARRIHGVAGADFMQA